MATQYPTMLQHPSALSFISSANHDTLPFYIKNILIITRCLLKKQINSHTSRTIHLDDHIFTLLLESRPDSWDKAPVELLTIDWRMSNQPRMLVCIIIL